MKPAAIIEFEDKGQDFLFWELDRNGYVINSEPFQKEIWEGTWVDTLELEEGHCPIIRIPRLGDELRNLSYKVKSIKWPENN